MKLFYSSCLVALLGFFLTTASPLLGQAAETKAKKIPFHGKLLSVDASAQTITLAGKSARVFHLTPTTKITDGSGAPSSLSAAVVGEDVGGSYTKEAAGTLTLFSVRFGAKAGTAAATAAAATPAPAAPAPATPPPAPVTPPTPPPAPKVAATTPAAPAPAATEAAAAAKVKKQTFSGKVVSVDAAANTLVVHGKADQTFTVTPTTKILDATGKTTTLADAVAGTKVTGSYSKSADGATLTVYTLKITK